MKVRYMKKLVRTHGAEERSNTHAAFGLDQADYAPFRIHDN